MKRRKILGWGAGAVAGVGLLAMMLLAFSMGRTGRQYRAFEKEFDGAEERVTHLKAQLNEQFRAGADRSTSGTHAVASLPVRAAGPATTQTLFAREFAVIQQDWLDLVREAEHLDTHIYPPFLLEAGIGGATITFDAGEFPDEGTKGGLRGGTALRGRIRQEAGKILKDDTRRRSTRLSATANALSSGPLAATMDRLLDRTGRLLLDDAAEPDPEKDTALYTYPYHIELIGSAAALRAELRGQRAEAGRMLERLLRVQLQARVKLFPHPGNFWMTQKTLMLLAEEGKLGDSSLARIEAMLRRARIDDKQLADLRAAYVLARDREIEDADEQEYAWGVRNGRNRALLLFETQAQRTVNALLLSAMRPVMMNWVKGDEAAYDRAVRHPVNVNFFMFVTSRFPPELAAFSHDSAANDAVDQTRLVVAAARWRLARGRWPERIEDLIPQYLEAGFASGAESFYAVDRLETPASSGKKGEANEPAASRPIFYHARRLALTPLRLTGLQFGSGQFPVSNQVRSFDEPDDHSLWVRLGLRGERQMLGLMTSDRRVEGIVVRAVWPNPEPLATGWARGIKGEALEENEAGVEFSSNQTNVPALKK